MLTLVTLMAAALFLLVLPLLLLKLAFKVVFGLILLPFKLLGLVFGLVLLPFKLLGLVLGMVFGVLGFAARAVFAGLGLVFSLGGALFVLAAALFVLVLIPLLPFLLLGLGIWLVVRAPARRDVLRVA